MPLSIEKALEYSKLVDEFGFKETCKKYELKPETLGRYLRYANSDKELVRENVRYKKEKQKLQDLNRVERKSFREQARVENAVEEYNKALLEELKKVNLSPPKIIKSKANKAVGVIHLSDLHFNELISESFNKYDFNIASKRLKLYIAKAKTYLLSCGVQNILIADTGDKLNSDRRLDELMNQATNRAKATLLSVYILEQMIYDLLENFNITFASVTGNESRAKDELGWSDYLATDNYDFTIQMFLKYIFRDVKNVEFIDGDPTELVVEIAGQNLLLVHGNQLPNLSGLEKAIQQMVGKYALRGVIISYVIMGHFHSARLGDIYSRGSSLAGANAYSDKGLQLASRASQNVYLFWNDGNRDAIKIDVQETTGEGYKILKTLEAYHAKSAEKTHHKEIIYQIVV